MSLSQSTRRKATARALLLFASPEYWSQWPFLPVIRRIEGQPTPQCGLLYDARGHAGICGYSATVFLANLFALPTTVERLFLLPRFVYDTAEEIANDGWVVD